MEGTDAAPAPATPPLDLGAALDLEPIVAPSADRTLASFTALYRGEYERHVRLAFLLVGNREQAEEVVQDAFVRLHGRWARVENPCGYLRTAVVKDGRMAVQAGAGIVYDSDPASEQQECVNKARALFRAAEDAIRFASRARFGQ